MILALLLLSLAAAKGELPVTKIARETKAYHYSIEWPAEAAAIPGLDKSLRAQSAEAIDEFTTIADEAYRDSKSGQGSWFPENGYELGRSYGVAGKTDALLSLSGDWYSYTGGAHGIFGMNALLWDRNGNRQIAVADLFERVSEFILMHPAMCDALNKQRAEKRDGEKMDTGFDSLDDSFNGCPEYDSLTIWIGDDDKNGRFDKFNFFSRSLCRRALCGG